jgi:hypothetical protein
MNRRSPANRLPRSVQIRYETNRLASVHLRDAYEQLIARAARALPRTTAGPRDQERKKLV